jgi:hypothetical protein
MARLIRFSVNSKNLTSYWSWAFFYQRKFQKPAFDKTGNLPDKLP